MKIIASLLLLIPSMAIASETYTCDAHFMKKHGDSVKEVDYRAKDIKMNIKGRIVDISQNSSNYSGSFNLSKDEGGIWIGTDDKGTTIIRHPNSLYTMSFSQFEIRDITIFITDCQA